jgi:hypothetical protein
VVTVTAGGRRQRQVLAGGNGFFAKNEAVLYFGLGGETAATEVEVVWPNGRVEHWHNVSADQKLRLIEGRGE